MTEPDTRASALSLNVRILIGIAALPSLALAVMIIISVMSDGVSGVGGFEVLYSVVGIVALYIAISGKRLF